MEPQPAPPSFPATADWRAEAAAWRAKAEHLQMAVDRLRSLAAAGEAVGFLAHELNNLFTPVAGYCQAASADGAGDELRAKALRKALVASERVGELSRAILGLAGSASARRVDAEEGEESCEVGEAVGSALLVLGVERWEKEGIQVRVEVTRGTSVGAPACVVQQVVMNLALNARRAMEGRCGAIHVACDVAGGMVRLEVRDCGGGMEREVMARVGLINFGDDGVGEGRVLRSVGGAVDGRSCGASAPRGSGGPLRDGRGSGAVERYEVDVQELARSGSINGQARFGVRVRGGRSGKVPRMASEIRVWDGEEMARELRSAQAEGGGRRAEVGGEKAKVQRSTFNVQGEDGGGASSTGRKLRAADDGAPAPAAAQGAHGERGAGLGLALCVELVRRFGGRMSAQSVVGEGTVVVVELPAARGIEKRAA